MNNEQTTIRAVVRATEGKSALVEVEQGGCGRCHEKGGCGGQHLTQMFCAGPKTYQVDNTIGAEIGDRVTIAIAAGSVRQTANLAYGIPLLSCIGGAAMGAQLGGDGGAMIGAASGLVLSFLYIRIHAQTNAGNSSERPHIVSRS
jgi:sigma-E factor negative regulatory protein RseC